MIFSGFNSRVENDGIFNDRMM